VHHGRYVDRVIFIRVYDSIRKPVNQAAPETTPEPTPQVRMPGYRIQRRLDMCQELLAQFGSAVLVKQGRLAHLRDGGRVEDYPHRVSSFLMRATALTAGTALH